jgi:hypothetical protein
MKASVILAMIPLVLYDQVWGLLPTPPKATKPYVAVAVTSEGVRRVPLDTRTFNARWRAVNDMPPAAPYIATPLIRDEEETYMVMPVPVPAPRPELRATPRPRSIRKRGGGDICSRHHMHKVVTKGGRSWRCRK